MCLLLNMKALTWDASQMKNKHDLGWCSLGKSIDEINYHLIMSCAFTQQVWKEIEGLI